MPNSYVRGNLAHKLSSRHTHQTDCSTWTTKVVGYHTPLRTLTSAKLKEIRAVEKITNLLTNDELQLRPSVDSSFSASFFRSFRVSRLRVLHNTNMHFVNIIIRPHRSNTYVDAAYCY